MINNAYYLPKASYSISLIIFPRIIVLSPWLWGPAFLSRPTINTHAPHQTSLSQMFEGPFHLGPLSVRAILLPGVPFPVPLTQAGFTLSFSSSGQACLPSCIPIFCASKASYVCHHQNCLFLSFCLSVYRVPLWWYRGTQFILLFHYSTQHGNRP